MAMALVRGVLGNPAPDQADPNTPAGETPTPGSDASLAAGLAKYIRDAYETARNYRNLSGVDESMMMALRAVRGEYSPAKLNAIKQMQGSEVFLRISANKVRSVAAALRDVYASNDRPWGIEPTSEPETPFDAQTEATIQQVLQAEVKEAALSGAGSAITPQLLFDRQRALRDLLYQHTMEKTRTALRMREDAMDGILEKGGFYQALWDFLLDIPTFPFAVLKGPVVYYKNQLHWENGKPAVKSEPTMTWERCSPFDVYFAPWAQRAQDGYIVHKQRATRASLQALIGLPSYDKDALMEVLDRTPESLKDWFSYIEQERSELEQRASDTNNIVQSNAVDKPFPMLEFHGPVSGKLLIEWGMDASQVPDDSKDLDITAWLVDTTVIGVRLNPHPLGHKPFYVDSFERVPGSIYGLGVPKMIEDIQDAGNATLRSLVNNMAIASGPQVGVNEARLNGSDTSISMWPWKVWGFSDDPTGTGKDVPFQFFQPASNAGELLTVLKSFMEMADTFSSMPQYMQGNAQGMATVGRTSSGLSMLMDAANRTMKQSVTSIDKNVIEAVINDLNVYLAILRPDIVNDGDINIVAKGASELVQREQLRMRRLNFLQVTGSNPMDQQIIGVKGRTAIITEIARDLQLPIDEIVTGAQQPPAPPPGQPGAGGPQAPQNGPGGAMAGAPSGPAPSAPPPAVPQETNPTAGIAAPPKV
jgi:hypothetical protein